VPPQAVYRFSDHVLDLGRGSLRNGEGELRLRPKSFEVLTYFVKNAGRLLPKDELLQAAWPGVYVTEDSLVQCVKEIRRAIGDTAQDAIKTIPGRGYIFDVQVSLIDAAIEKPPPAHGWLERIRAVDWRILAAAIGIFAIGSGVIGWWLRAPADAPALAAPRLSIAVLLGGDPGDEFIANDVTDNLTNGLSTRVPELIVRNAPAALRGKFADGAQAGRGLGVRYVIEGSVQRNDDRITVTAELIDTQSGARFWRDRFEAQRSELFALEDRIVGRIASALGDELIRPAALDAEFRGSAPLPEDLGLRGPAPLAQPQALNDVNEAEALFRDALAIDDGNVGALEGLATTLLVRLVNFPPQRQADRDDLMRHASEAADRALSLGEERASAHFVKGVLLRAERKPSEAAEEFQRALDRDHAYAAAYDGLGASKLLLGQPGEASHILEQAVDLGSGSPVRMTSAWHLGVAELFLGHDDRALQWFHKAREEDPARGWWLLRELTAVYALKGEEEDARRCLAELLRIWPQLSIAALEARLESDNRDYLRLWGQTLHAGLQKAGLPEE